MKDCQNRNAGLPGLLLFISCLLLTGNAPAKDGASHGSAVAPTACDLLASHPSDPDKVTAGVATDQVKTHMDSAIAACQRDAAAYPQWPRLTYYLGRAQFYSGNTQDGFANVKAAAEAGHEQAQFVTGLLAMRGVATGSPDACLARDYWEQGRAQGHFAATVSMATHQKTGSFQACTKPGPDPAAVRASVAALATHGFAADYYNGLLLNVLQVDD